MHLMMLSLQFSLLCSALIKQDALIIEQSYSGPKAAAPLGSTDKSDAMGSLMSTVMGFITYRSPRSRCISSTSFD